jgi:uncharacterized sodium:solute symporter family permease YidK
MIRAIAILQLVMLAAILSFGYWRKRRAGRSTYLDTCLVFLLLIFDMTAFALYGDSLDGDDAKQWRGYFPDGQLVLPFVLFGVLYAVVIGPIIAVWRPLLRPDKNNLKR